MKNNTLILITIITVFSINGYAQKEKICEADKKIVTCVYVDVIKTYERVAEKGYKSIDMFKKIGDSYYSNFDLEIAARWYCELFAMTSELEPKYYYQYALSLKSIGQNDKANEMLEKFNLISGKVPENKFQK